MKAIRFKKLSKAIMAEVGRVLHAICNSDSSELRTTGERVTVRLAQASLHKLLKRTLVAVEFSGKEEFTLNFSYAEALAFYLAVRRTHFANDLFMIEILDAINQKVVCVGHGAHKLMLGA